MRTNREEVYFLAITASPAGFLLLMMPWEQLRQVGALMLLIGLGISFLCLVWEVMINQAYWKPKRQADRERLTELAGRQHGPRQVTSMRVSLVEGAEGKIRTEVRMEVRKRV